MPSVSVELGENDYDAGHQDGRKMRPALFPCKELSPRDQPSDTVYDRFIIRHVLLTHKGIWGLGLPVRIKITPSTLQPLCFIAQQ